MCEPQGESSPILVKRSAFSFGLSSGNMLVHYALISGSAECSLSVGRPMLSVTSCIMVLKRMRLELVESPSFILIACSIAQEMAPFARRWLKSCAMLRKRLSATVRCNAIFYGGGQHGIDRLAKKRTRWGSQKRSPQRTGTSGTESEGTGGGGVCLQRG
jgi:hypothetical protein